MEIDCSVAAVAVSEITFEVTPLCAALMSAVPVANAVARPALLIVAVAGFDELQVAEFVRFCVVPSLNVPVALN